MATPKPTRGYYFGHEIPSDLQPKMPDGPAPKFGHEMLQQFKFDPNYLNLNNGSYGSLPKPVDQHCIILSDTAEANPDLFMRRTMLELSVQVRQGLAKLINADVEEVVLVPNATHGINTVLRNFDWQANDVLIGFSTTYGAISRTLQYISDLPPHPKLQVIPLRFPTTHKEISTLFRDQIKSIVRTPGQKIVAVIDAIVSNPGCVLPWEEMVETCRKEGVWSVVDAAHSVGQVKSDMKAADPDFWISNCHKWLLTKRSVAVMYVPKRNQHVVKSSFPTSFDYVSPSDPQIPGAPVAPNFVKQFEWNGTLDFTPYLSVTAALRFREWIGGEDAIDNYCHKTAMEGGLLMAKILGTEVMDPTGELTAHMVNVAIPFPDISHLSPDQKVKIRYFIEDELLSKHQTFVATFVHNDRWWARCSCHVWNEVADFERMARMILVLAKDLKKEIENMQGSIKLMSRI